MSSYERMFSLSTEPLPELLSLRDIEIVRQATERVAIPESMIYMLFELKTAMEEKEYTLSDRRWRKIGQVWKTSTALNGRDEVTVWDTVFTPHMLWDFPEDLPVMQELFQHSFQRALKKEAERELPLRRYEDTVNHWRGKEEGLHAFQFKKEIGGRLTKEEQEKARDKLESCRVELEETARELRGKLIQWLQREKDLPGFIGNRNFLLLHTDRYAVKYAHLRIDGERILQSLQELYRNLFGREIPGLHYDYTL
jgi:MoxR-like ATPase